MLELLGKALVGLLLLVFLYVGYGFYRMYTADPSENVSVMGEGKAGILSCMKQVKSFISHENCDRGR